MHKVLIIDDEQEFRESLSKRMTLRGYNNITLEGGEDAVKTIRSDKEIDVVVLDRKMPGLSGEQVLKEIKQYRPELQVIILTGHGSVDSAVEAGKLDAYTYLQKPCEFEELMRVVDAAREAKVFAMERYEIPVVEKGSFKKWLIGTHNSRPGIIILGLILMLVITLSPTPKPLLDLLSFEKTGQLTDINVGYANWGKMKVGQNMAEYYGEKYGLGKLTITEVGKKIYEKLSPEEAAFRAKVMLCVLIIAAMFWASGAIPMGVTALLVGVIMYFTGVMNPDDIAQAYAKDAVIFIFGILVMAHAISKTGLDKRIGLLLLGPSTSLPRLLFLFLPLMGIVCSFVSEHALVAFVMPLFIMVYATSVRNAGIKADKALIVMLVLSLCFAANCGGPGSPAAGGRNAVMMAILVDYGMPISFGSWVKYGLPFVPVMALVIGAYFYIVLRRKVKVKQLNVSYMVKQASQKIGPMTKQEYLTAAILVMVILLWITASDKFGMGGPVILAIVLLNVFRIIAWKDIANIQWEVVALYASASAMGKGLAVSGAALYLADSFVKILPSFMQGGEGLAVAVSLFTGITTNFMSDGATVSAIGPITIPMATISGTHPWMVGLATAFASSFAHMMIIGTPNNAIAYAMSKDPVTGEQLVTLGDFFKHGFAVLVLSLIVLWGWTFFGYWRWIGF